MITLKAVLERASRKMGVAQADLKNFEHMIEALAFVKKAAAQANCELGCSAKIK